MKNLPRKMFDEHFILITRNRFIKKKKLKKEFLFSPASSIWYCGKVKKVTKIFLFVANSVMAPLMHGFRWVVSACAEHSKIFIRNSDGRLFKKHKLVYNALWCLLLYSYINHIPILRTACRLNFVAFSWTDLL